MTSATSFTTVNTMDSMTVYKVRPKFPSLSLYLLAIAPHYSEFGCKTLPFHSDVTRCMPHHVGFQFFDVPSRRVGAAPTPTGTTTAAANNHDNEDIFCRSDTRTKTRHGGRTRYACIFLLYLFYYTYSTGWMSPFNSRLQPTPTPMPTTMKTAAAANNNANANANENGSCCQPTETMSHDNCC